MKQKILVVTIATALIAPVATHADVKLSGTIQAEVGAYQAGKDAKFEDNDRVRVSKDGGGSISNGGPNMVAIDMDEKLGDELMAYARYRFNFSTMGNTAGLQGNEAWLGLKGNSAFFRIGTLIGNYGELKIDPFADTALQARGTAGGMSGGKYNAVEVNDTIVATMPDNYNHAVALQTAAVTSTEHSEFAHDDPVENAIEIGATYKGFTASLQGVYDETDDLNGAGLVALSYKDPDGNFTAYAAGSFLNLSDTAKATLQPDSSGNVDDSDYNWKVGGSYTISGATIGVQYEDAELGYMDEDINPNGGKYIMGSVDYQVNPQLLVGGWVATYLSDIKENERLVRQDGAVYEYLDEDAISFAIGVKYLFSKRTLAFGGYRQVDSDNDYRDENAFGIGIRHSF